MGPAARRASTHDGDGSANRNGDFLLWVVGANPAYITDVSERRWYHSMGLAVLMVSMFAFIGAATTLAFRFDDPRVWIVGGLIWAMAVFIVDRGITSYVERYPTLWRKLITVLPRVALAVIAAVAVSEALVLNLLSNEIQQQLTIMNAKAADERRTAATFVEQPELNRIEAKIDQLTADRNRLKNDYDLAQLKVTCETGGGRSAGCAGVATTTEVGRGPLVREQLEPAAAAAKADADKAQRAYDAYLVDVSPSKLTGEQLSSCLYTHGQLLTQADQQRCAITARIATAAAVPPEATRNVVLNRVIAAFQIGEPGSSERSGSHLVHAVLFGLFLFLDLTPLIMKISRGPTAHDEAARAAMLPPLPRFDDRRLSSSMWADPGIGAAAMEAARDASANFYKTHYQEQAQRRLDRDAVTDPAPTSTNGTAVFPTTGPGPVSPNGTSVYSGFNPTTTDPGTGAGDATRRQDNLEDNSAPFDQRELVVGAELEHQFRLVRPLRQGGPYDIWRVRDLLAKDGEPVDLVAKIVKDSNEDAKYGYKGLQHEVDVGRVEHPNIVPAWSKVCRDNLLKVAYRIMPFYRGGHLGKWIENHPERTLADMLDVGDGILAGLEEGHKQRFTHWDIKPENVLMGDNGTNPRPVVGDWANGKAHYQFSGQSSFERRGTPDYCAPEQVTRTRERDRRCYASDLYSSAAVMFYFVEETSPRRAAAERDDADVAAPWQYQEFIQANRPMPRLAGRIPSELAELIHRWLAFEPEDRFLPVGTRLTDHELRERQVVSDARQELVEVRAGLSPEQLATPVRLMTGQQTAPW